MTFLSSPALKRYRLILYIVAVLLVAASCFFILQDLSKLSFRLLSSINMVAIAYLLVKRAALLKTVSYDSVSLYIREKDQEEVIPLTAVRKVDLKTLGGRWEVHFHPAYTNREVVHFLPSLLYPLNYRKIEAKIEDFHQVIREARKKRDREDTHIPGLALSALSNS